MLICFGTFRRARIYGTKKARVSGTDKPHNWRKCTLFDVNFHPLQMTRERLEHKFYELAAALYSSDAVAKRHRRFVDVYGPRWRSARITLPSPVLEE